MYFLICNCEKYFMERIEREIVKYTSLFHGKLDFGWDRLGAAKSWLSYPTTLNYRNAVRYESHDRAAPKIAAPEIYFSLPEAQRGIIPNFFRYINCK